jgi:hypothetical protein
MTDQTYKRVQVIFSEEQYELIKLVREKLGLGSDSETVRIIVLLWFAEKSIISSLIKNELVRVIDYDK